MTPPSLRRLDQITAHLLKNSPPRSPNSEFRVGNGGEPVRLVTAEERAAAAMGTLLLWKLVQHGGSLLPVGPVQSAAERLLDSLPEIDRRRIAGEAEEVLRWLESNLNLLGDDWQEMEDRGLYPWEDRHFPDAGKADVIVHAIQAGSDLEIEYFTYSRNAMTKRRVTPLELEDGSKLRALCHWRRDERRFLLARIKEARPLPDTGPKVPTRPVAGGTPSA